MDSSTTTVSTILRTRTVSRSGPLRTPSMDVKSRRHTAQRASTRGPRPTRSRAVTHVRTPAAGARSSGAGTARRSRARPPRARRRTRSTRRGAGLLPIVSMLARLPLLLLAASGSMWSFSVGHRADTPPPGIAACASSGDCYRTVQQCVDAVLTAPCTSDTPCNIEVRCNIKPGIFHEAIVIEQQETHHQRSLTLTGSSSASSVLTGAEALHALEWTHHSGKIYKAQLPVHLRGVDVQQLWINGEMGFEARWPNANLSSVVTQDSWATTTNSCAPTNTSHVGWLADPALARANISFAGGLVTLNAGTRVWTWTRRVDRHIAGDDNLTYSGGQLVPEKGGASGLEMLYFVSGTLSLLDTENEWWIDHNSSTLYLWPPNGVAPPSGSISVKTHDLCVDSRTIANVRLEQLDFFGCTFALHDCDGCSARNINLDFPSYSREVNFRNLPVPGSVAIVPNVTLISGNRSLVERVQLRHSNIAGLVLIGSGHIAREILISNVDWLGSLDFPAIQIGFAAMECRYGHHFRTPTFDPSVCGHDVEHRPATPTLGVSHGFVAHPRGDRNLITKVTIRRYGGGGIVTSQLSNEVSFAHLSEGQLIGLDQAGIHADNLDAHTSDLCRDNNCTKEWHHIWVHDQREKGIRGDDGTVNTSIHHCVVFNCGGKPAAMMTPRASGCGIMIKGDYNNVSANTIFNVGDQGDLVVDTRRGPPCSADGCVRENAHSRFKNCAMQRIAVKHGGTPLNATATTVCGIIRGNLSHLDLRNSSGFDFRPATASPLRGAGCEHTDVPQPVDVGAYQHDDPHPWRPGCTFSPGC